MEEFLNGDILYRMGVMLPLIYLIAWNILRENVLNGATWKRAPPIYPLQLSGCKRMREWASDYPHRVASSREEEHFIALHWSDLLAYCRRSTAPSLVVRSGGCLIAPRLERRVMTCRFFPPFCTNHIGLHRNALFKRSIHIYTIITNRVKKYITIRINKTFFYIFFRN